MSQLQIASSIVRLTLVYLGDVSWVNVDKIVANHGHTEDISHVHKKCVLIGRGSVCFSGSLFPMRNRWGSKSFHVSFDRQAV